MKYRLHKLNMDDIAKIEDKAGLELESGILEGTFCLVDKEGKVFLDKGNHLLVYKAIGLDITDGNLGVKDGLMEAAQAVAYFKNICHAKVKIPTIWDIISEGFDGKIKGLGRIESIDIVQLQYNGRPNSYLCSLDAIKDWIASAFDTSKTQMRQVRDLTTPDIATNIINAEYKDVYEDEYEDDDYPEDDEYEDDYEDEDDDYEDDDPEEEDEEERE
jgi:hypothetical protein